MFSDYRRFSVPTTTGGPRLTGRFLHFLCDSRSMSTFTRTSNTLCTAGDTHRMTGSGLSATVCGVCKVCRRTGTSSLVVDFTTIPTSYGIGPGSRVFGPVASIVGSRVAIRR